MKNRLFVTTRTKRGTAFAAVLLGIAIACDPDGAAAVSLPSPMLNRRAVIPIGWDTGGFDRNFNRNYDTSGFDRRFNRRNSANGYDTNGFDRRFDSRTSTRGYDTGGWDLPPNTNRRR